ncbi:MAG: hypothetical protein ACKPGK_06955, partial [Verrucomicrobiota bacterium]
GPGQFVQDLYKGVLPINELAKSVGLGLPAFLGSTASEVPPGASAPAAPAVPVPSEPKPPVMNPTKPSA